MIHARPEVSLGLVVLNSGGEESREEFGEGVRRDWSLLRLWRGRWIVISRVRDVRPLWYERVTGKASE
jgi:hypothetical protein